MTQPTTKGLVPNVKFHSTNQFRNAVKNIQTKARFKGLDEEGDPIIDETAIAPTLAYTGTVKLHGTNASIILHEDGAISFHSKNNILGAIDNNGEFLLNSDNAKFAQTMWRRKEAVYEIATYAETLCMNILGDVEYPIKISGEWCGYGAQSKVGISFLPTKSLFIFGIKVQDEWLPVKEISSVCCDQSGIYNIMNFPTKSVTIDFNNPAYSQNELVEATDAVEEKCPVSKQLGIEQSLLGEGLVWIPNDPELAKDSGNWFKTKGEKHSVSKTKSVAAVCPEKLNSIKEFVEYACTDNRMEQGIGEVGLNQKDIGTFIGWVNKDINKEEGDVLESNNLTMKDVGKYTANKARMFFLSKLNKM